MDDYLHHHDKDVRDRTPIAAATAHSHDKYFDAGALERSTVFV
jgi:hypothetical protein